MESMAGPVFTIGGRVPIDQFVKLKATFDAVSGVKDWMLHDLRRTMAKGLERHGALPHVADLVLSHTPGAKRGIAGVYLRHGYAAEKRDTLERWGGHPSGLPQGGLENVVPLRSGI